MKKIILLITCLSVMSAIYACKNETKEGFIRMAVERQMKAYPRSTLRDLYKNFFQDRFGPGHIVADTVAAGKYLRTELASCDTIHGRIYEPTGYEGNFYRVNLSAIKEGIVPYHMYFDAFVRSVNGIEAVSVEEWSREWGEIESVIDNMELQLPDYEQDKREISKLLQSGKYVMHHSRNFIEAYAPHYRIIEKSIFEKEMLPFINKIIEINEE